MFHYFPRAIAYLNADDWQRIMKTLMQTFAETILAIAKPGDQIWVHDYQLMFLPALLRQANPEFIYCLFSSYPVSILGIISNFTFSPSTCYKDYWEQILLAFIPTIMSDHFLNQRYSNFRL